VLYVLQIIRTISSKSSDVCGRIVDTGLHEVMLEFLSRDVSSVNTDQSNANARFVNSILFTLQNIVRRSEPARVALKNCQAVDILQKFRHHTENLVIVLRILFFTVVALSYRIV